MQSAFSFSFLFLVVCFFFVRSLISLGVVCKQLVLDGVIEGVVLTH